MTTETTLHPLADRYLKDLRRSARVLPRGRRDELRADIHDHLSETAPAGAGEADVRTALDRLGDADEIVAAEAGAGPVPGRRGVLEWCAIVLLPIGGVVIPVIGWIVGALLLWISRSWTLRDKVWGTLILPGGLLPAAWLVVADDTIESCHSSARGQVCTGAPTATQQTINIAFFVGALVLPFVTTVYLARRAQRPVGAR